MLSKSEANQLQNNGRIILRSQIIKGKWVIVCKTLKGAWSRYTSEWYDSQLMADSAILSLAENDPKIYHYK